MRYYLIMVEFEVGFGLRSEILDYLDNAPVKQQLRYRRERVVEALQNASDELAEL
jgi:hypothetical protein